MITVFKIFENNQYWEKIEKFLKHISEDIQLDIYDEENYCGFLNITPWYNSIAMKIVDLYNQKNKTLLKLLKKYKLNIEDKPNYEEMIFITTMTEKDWYEKDPEKWEKNLRKKNLNKFNI